ncbi:cation:proton antiporter, partial [Kitasatospora sp. NPDC059577]|uniref:cation:proton antiporter domain-containing protein n=1 Tax=Kitasatospora sp. NPDC059577 TaxID=3346873 RepID=UPI0036D19CFC
MTTDAIFLGLGLTAVLAVGSQVLARWLRVPALIVLLPVGFTAGALTDDLDPERLLGPAFSPLVSLSVALILYDAGLGLDLEHLRGHNRRVVVRLLLIGAVVTGTAAALLAAQFLGMSSRAALMLGAILVVSGPTGVGARGNSGRPRVRRPRGRPRGPPASLAPP